MKINLFLLVFALQASMLRAQFVCYSDSTAIYEFPGTALPPMIGEAAFSSGFFKVVVGGKFLDLQLPESESVYNCDMIVVDYKALKTYVLPLSYFPPFVADQFAGYNFCYTSDKDTAYIMGGFGYDLAKGYETSFPTMTIFPIRTLIDSVVQHKDFMGVFDVVDDPRLAITEGKLVRIGQYFLVYNGREISTAKEEFSDCILVNEWNYQGQLRKFTLKNTEGFREVSEFQLCNTAKVFYECMPESWRPTPKTYQIDN